MFDIHPTKAYGMTNAQLMDDGENPVVVNSSFNNGIGGYTTQPITEQGGTLHSVIQQLLMRCFLSTIGFRWLSSCPGYVSDW